MTLFKQMLIAGVLALAPMVPGRAEACSCVDLMFPPPPRAELKKALSAELDRAVAVFVAEVIGVERTTATLTVKKQWKGNLPAKVSIRTGVELGADDSTRIDTCDWDYVRGETYFVFAYGPSVAQMKATKCGLTQKAAAAKTTIALLDELARGRSSR